VEALAFPAGLGVNLALGFAALVAGMAFLRAAFCGAFVLLGA
jgi:hypothetical protein